jgi:glycosyltransferase involved in cell wall biosynthesis
VTAVPISICVPVFNGARWLEEALRSALAQTRSDFELLVVDNGSTDGSVEIARNFAARDSRVRVEPFDHNVGAVENHNRCIDLAAGALIKFLHHDDVLEPQCIARMAAIFEEEPSTGLVFSRREIVLDEPDDAEAQAWTRAYGTLHEGFGALGRVNRGPDLLERWLPALDAPGPLENWVAEPSATMLRREVFERVGQFNPHVWQSFDVDLFLRVMAVFDVGFVDEPLVRFRHHARSITARTARSHADWLDRLWLFESLLAAPGFEQHKPVLRSFRRRELIRVAKRQAGRLARRNWDVRPLVAYLGHRLRRR